MPIHARTPFIGVEYYRHPNPAFEDWERDLAMIRETGLKMVRTWLYWSHVNPKPHVWDFSDYDRFVDLAAKNDLSVLIQLVAESAPQWWIAQLPNARLRNADGSAYEPEAHGMVAVGGYPGLSPDVEGVRVAIHEFLTRTVERYRGLSNLYAYDVWNEIMPYYSFNTCLYHPETQIKFREWLVKKYGTIENLNAAWGDWRFTGFGEITMNPKGNYASLLDLFSFQRDWITDFMEWKVSVVKEVEPVAIALSHSAGGLQQLTGAPHDLWALAERIDVWGLSDYEEDFYRSCLFLQGTASSSRGKRWWLSEQTGGRVWGLFGHAVRSPQFVEQKMLAAFSYGAEANLVWQWRPERFGQESPNFGLTNEDGSPHANTAIVSRLAKALDRRADIFSSLDFAKPDVGLVMDWRLRSWEYAAFGDPVKFGEPELVGWFRALTEVGANVDVLNLETMVRDGIPVNIRLLILPLCIQDQAGLQELLKKFVEGGGHLVAQTYFLTYDESAYVSPQAPPTAMQELFGCKRETLTYPHVTSERFAGGAAEAEWDVSRPNMTGGPLTFLPGVAANGAVALRGHHVLETYSMTTARPIAHTCEAVSATANSVRKGVAYRVGSLLGTAYDSRNNDGLAAWLRTLLSAAGCQPFPSATGGAVTRCARLGDDTVVFVANPKEASIVTWISAPKAARSVRNLITDEEITMTHAGQVALTLAARETRVLLLSDGSAG